MKNGSWNKSKNKNLNKNNNKNVDIQHMKDELFIMKYGYWVKTDDVLDNLNKEIAIKKWKYLNRRSNYKEPFNYLSKSKYPDIILQKKDNIPYFDNNNIEYHNNLDNDFQNILIIDNKNSNHITYKHIDYIFNSNIDNKYFDFNKPNCYNDNIKYELLKKQLDIKIKSLESMINLFEKL